MREDRCVNCKFWLKNPTQRKGGNDYGDCHRYPPRHERYSSENWQSDAYPVTHEDDWCGEHETKPPAKDDKVLKDAFG